MSKKNRNFADNSIIVSMIKDNEVNNLEEPQMENSPYDQEGESFDDQTTEQEEVTDNTQDEDRVAEGGKTPPQITRETNTAHLSGKFRSWFLEYASYTNLDRAIPHINDGLKPVQRRVLYTMRKLEDGRYNKVSSIAGSTMSLHPHGDASIMDALVNIGQKGYLVDTQGNWGNVLTGAEAAAGRYIEARLTKFALEVLFNNKTTQWRPSYDGRQNEPITLPAKFPILLIHGTQGIGLGMNTYILPHNFNEVCDAAVSYLKGEEFHLYPDFPTGGQLDVTKYNDGERGGKVVARAKIEKLDNKTLKICDALYGVNSTSLIESIILAKEKGKLNITKIDNVTAETFDVRVTLAPNTSSDKTIDALYAFTKCQVSISPNCCVIDNDKPLFISVSELLRRNVESTKELIAQEFKIAREETFEQLFLVSLEKIFIEERIYKDEQFEKASNLEVALKHIDSRLEPYKAKFIREITRDDLLHLLEIKMARILKFNATNANKQIAAYKDKIKELDYKIEHIVDQTIAWFEYLKKKYGEQCVRQTELRTFDTINAVKVVQANEKLYVNKKKGFVGINLGKDPDAEFVCPCSDIDDIVIFFANGKFKVTKVGDKIFAGEDIIYTSVFRKNDMRTIYNVIYQNGKNPEYYIKRFALSSIKRDTIYDITMGTEGTKIKYFTANPNGEAEIVKITLKQAIKRKSSLTFEKNFADILIKSRQSRGNLLTKHEIKKIELKEHGVSTLGGIDIWFDPDVARLNGDGRGQFLGNFEPKDQILLLHSNGDYYVTSFDFGNHFDDDMTRIEKYNPKNVWTAVLYNGDQKSYYLKRFPLEPTNKRTSFLATEAASKLIYITSTPCPRLQINFEDEKYEPLVLEADEFIDIKSLKAKGKRVTLNAIKSVEELEPTHEPTPQKVENEDDAMSGIEIISTMAMSDEQANELPADAYSVDDEGQISVSFDKE